MEEGCQRRALPARRHIGAAQVAHHGNAERPRQRRAVANLPGPAPVGPMRHRMAVKADHPNVLCHMPATPQQVRDRLDM